MRVVLLWLLRLGLGALFVVAGGLKLQDPATFAGEIQNYHVLPEIAPLLAATLPGIEIAVGLALLVGPVRWLRAGALVTVGMLSVFTIAVASAVARGIDVSCGCFGAGSGPVSIETVARDVALLVAASVLFVVSRTRALADLSALRTR
jgi:uncharacterized membrane protein YphA (DoxX/SURF4 family)